MSVERPALLPLIFIEKAIARFGYVRAMAFVMKNIEPFPPPVIWLRLGSWVWIWGVESGGVTEGSECRGCLLGCNRRRRF